MITKKDIEKTLQDFETFCNFIEKNKPKLTPARSELGKKECFELNKLLSNPKGFKTPKYLQVAYPSINLWFHISLAAGFFGVAAGKGSSRILVGTERLEQFIKLNPFSRYIFLFRVFWTMLDWDELYFETMDWIYHFFYIQIGFHALKDAVPGERLFADMDNFDQCYDRFNPMHRMFVGAGIVIHHLRDFGFWDYDRAYRKKPYYSERDIDVKAVTPTWLGVAMINACIKRPLEIYNPYLDQKRIRDAWSADHIKPVLEKLTLNIPKLVKKVEPFELVFKNIFPDEAIDMKGLEMLVAGEKEASGEAQPNVFLFKVSLGRGCWRTIKLSAAHTLQHLHDAIQEAFGFWDDHLFAFFMDGKPWSRDVYWDKREGSKPTADKAVLGKLGLSAGQKFLYLFDFGDEWRFTVKVEKFAHEVAPFKPVIVERYGDSPEQYPEYEE